MTWPPPPWPRRSGAGDRRRCCRRGASASDADATPTTSTTCRRRVDVGAERRATPRLAQEARLTDDAGGRAAVRDTRIDWGVDALLHGARRSRRIGGLTLRERCAAAGVRDARWTRSRPPRRRSCRPSPSEGAISLIWEPNTESDVAGYIVCAARRRRATLDADHAGCRSGETTFSDTVAGGRAVRVRGAGDRQGRERQRRCRIARRRAGSGTVQCESDCRLQTDDLRSICNLKSRSQFQECHMKLFIDTGNIKDIEALAALGIIDGVTTNPSLLAKEPGDFRENLKKICDIVKGPVSGEVVATDFAGHDARRPRHREDRRAHGRQGAAHARRHPGLQDAVGRRHPRQRHAGLLGRRRRCSRRRPARPSSARSSAGSTTSRRTAWS